MQTKTPTALDPKKAYAAQSAKDGLINVSDLSLLTGVAMAQLSNYAKKGLLRSYAEYHGKRFYNFKEIVTWLLEAGAPDEAKQTIRTTMEAELKHASCPYSLGKVTKGSDGRSNVEIIWKDF